MGETAGERKASAPLRGTQSFVGVIGEVWRRPSLTALEVVWRWCAGGFVLAQALWQWRGIHVDTRALEEMTIFQPVAAFHTMDVATGAMAHAMRPVAVWLVPVAVTMWLVLGALGRTLVLRRLDSGLCARPMAMLVLSALRMGLLALVWVIWGWLVLWAGKVAITEPGARGSDGNVVLYCAMVICASLLLYVLWAIFSGPLHLAPLLAMDQDLRAGAALDVAMRRSAVHGKLIEINLVLNIIKIAVLVFAMVFSASPLPFTEVATQTFLNWWWSGVLVLYLVTLDYFHVVRSVAYLRMWRALHT